MVCGIITGNRLYVVCNHPSNKDMNDVQMSAAKPVAEKTEIMQMRLPSCTCR